MLIYEMMIAALTSSLRVPEPAKACRLSPPIEDPEKTAIRRELKKDRKKRRKPRWQ
jgi:hypothetical protein